METTKTQLICDGAGLYGLYRCLASLLLPRSYYRSLVGDVSWFWIVVPPGTAWSHGAAGFSLLCLLSTQLLLMYFCLVSVKVE